MSEQPAGSHNLTRVEDLWFPRDTVVIRAENKIFQVSRAVLAARSTVFRDMTSLPQPPSSDTELIDGSPVVRLHDSAADVEAFLRAIFDASYFLPAPAPVTLTVVLGILKLSHKYDVEFLHRRALRHLGEHASCIDSDDGHIISNDNSIMRPLSIIDAATTVGALWLLPSAYYSACLHGQDQIMAFIDGPMQQYSRTCLLAYPHLVRATVTVNRFLTIDIMCGPTSRVCREIRRGMLTNVLVNVNNGNDTDPFDEWTEAEWQSFRALGICHTCYDAAQLRHKTDLATVWGALPKIFGLAPWEELHQMQRVAMGEDGSREE
ncbi:hypothetical protein C8R43DRAFT_611190 [Mycena crocata]|nr:hypothetical protein C8R43DRAFT_611190 [Mycena crocata]